MGHPKIEAVLDLDIADTGLVIDGGPPVSSKTRRILWIKRSRAALSS